MESLINILPEFVANQIAAGEVVNRPASAVKELLENAIDAGANNIELHLTDGGRTLIQVVDNGCGMSAEDADKCFLPHATSKLAQADDLHHILTMGFRGEALASIAAVAQVELQTRRKEDETGTRLCIEGGRTTLKEPCACAPGTNISVRNLYFNTPARREFLKSDDIEYRYAEEEFNRIALGRPDLCFELYRNGQKISRLDAANLNRRIVQVFGKMFENRLVKVAQNVPGLKLQGYVCTPEYSIKGRGKQFIFVNRRHIRHGGLSNAVEKAYQGLLPEGKSPAFVLHLEMNPEEIDVNIHPAKTEIRFKNQDLVYGVLHSAVKFALGVNQVRDSIDFESEQALPYHYKSQDCVPQAPKLHLNANYNPFDTHPGESTDYREAYARNFALMQEHMQVDEMPTQLQMDCINEAQNDLRNGSSEYESKPNPGEKSLRIFQIFDSYIITPMRSGLAVIDQEAASERVIYNSLVNPKENGVVSQSTLFPQSLEFTPAKADVLREIKDELGNMGWGLEWIGANAFMVNAMPQGVVESKAQDILSEIADTYAANLMQNKTDMRQNIALASAMQLSVKKGTPLSQEEILYLTGQLFAGEQPETSPSGKPIVRMLNKQELAAFFAQGRPNKQD